MLIENPRRIQEQSPFPLRAPCQRRPSVRMWLLVLAMLLCWGLPAGYAGQAPAGEEGALAALAQGRYEEAYDALFVLFQENPQDTMINFHLGQAAYGKGDYEAAIMAFERVLLLDPAAVEVKVELGKAYYRLGSGEMALLYLQEALHARDLPEDVRRQVEHFLQELQGNRK